MQQSTIFRAALRLIREGRFATVSLAEIAYHAHVTAATVKALFETREKLLTALGGYIYNELNTIIRVALHSKASFDEKFFRLWDALYCYYTANTDVAVFVDRCNHTEALRGFEKENRAMLIAFFSQSGLPDTGVTPEMMATIFHQNIRVAARNACTADGAMAGALARIIFEGLVNEHESSQESLEAA